MKQICASKPVVFALCMEKIVVTRATLAHLEPLAVLFDGYRVFYGQPSDVALAKKFLSERLMGNESVVFVAFADGAMVGFTQLYFTFSSVTAQKSLILNDLFVSATARGRGVGEALLRAAQQFTLENDYKGLALETAEDNPAQHLYERLGWQKDTGFFHYFWKTPT